MTRPFGRTKTEDGYFSGRGRRGGGGGDGGNAFFPCFSFPQNTRGKNQYITRLNGRNDSEGMCIPRRRDADG